MPLNDIECKHCETVEMDAFYRPNAGPPPCPKCGVTMTVTYRFSMGRSGGKIDNFTPVTVNGRHLGNREDWFAYRKELADQQGCDPEMIQMRDNNRHERNMRVEEAKHWDWLKRNRRGEVRRRKEEEAMNELLPHLENALQRYS